MHRRHTAGEKKKQDEERTLPDLGSCFIIKGLGEAEFHSGCHITRKREARILTSDKHIYAETVGKRFNVPKTSMIPTTIGVKPLSKEDSPKAPEERKNCGVPELGDNHD